MADNLRVKEPATKGKVIIHTTAGDLDIELWSKQCPKACRNFVQLCMEGYYNGTIFHRIIAGFLIQGGCKKGTGETCESIYGEPYPTERTGQLQFRYRGLVGVANAGKDTNSNGSQFFITLARADALNNDHTLFGKVTGHTMYNLVTIGNLEVGKMDRPTDPPVIRSTEVIWNPYDDITPRFIAAPIEVKGKKEEKKPIEAVRNKKVLSFDDEEEDDDDEDGEKEVSRPKMKSAHDVVGGRLIKETAYDEEEIRRATKRPRSSGSKSRSRSRSRNQKQGNRNNEAETDDNSPPGKQKQAPNEDNDNDDVRKEEEEERRRAESDDDDNSDAPDFGGDSSSEDRRRKDKVVLPTSIENKAAIRARERKEEMRKLKQDIKAANKDSSSSSESDQGETALSKRMKKYEKLKRPANEKKPEELSKEERERKKAKTKSILNDFRKRLSSKVENEDETRKEKRDDKDKEAKKTDKIKPELGTFAEMMNGYGDDEDSDDGTPWYSGAGLKFHISSDKAFQLDQLRGNESLETYDPMKPQKQDKRKDEERKKKLEEDKQMSQHGAKVRAQKRDKDKYKV